MLNELPYNLEAEQTVLGGLILSRGNAEEFHTSMGILKEEMFFSELNAEIFKVILLLSNASMPIELAAVGQHFTKESDRNYLAQVVKNSPGFKTIGYYVGFVNQSYQERNLIERLTMAINSLTEQGKHQDKMDKAMSLLSNVDDSEIDDSTYVPDLLSQYLEQLDTRFNNGGEIVGVATGFHELDERLNGLRGGDLVVVAGRPGMGKTTLAMNIAENLALNKGHVKVFSMEMPKMQLVERMVSSQGGINLGHLRSGRLSPDEWSFVNKGFTKASSLKINIDDRGALNIHQVKAAARKTHRRAKLDLIVLDYIQLMSGTKGHQNRVGEVTEITAQLKALAKELDIPVIALSQLSRKVEERPNKRPLMSDLRDSGSIEQDADIVIMMYRDDYYDKESPNPGTAEAIVCKHRNGEPGDVALLAELQFSRFKNFTGELVKPQPNAKPMSKSFATGRY